MKKGVFKKIFLLLFMFSLCACNNDNKYNHINDVMGLYYYTGVFSVFVPSGWSAVMKKEDAENYNNYQVYVVNKEGLFEETEIYDYPYILINYIPNDMEFHEYDSSHYDELENINVTINNQVWNGFSGEEDIVLSTEYSDGSHVEVSIIHNNKISLDDYEVKAILSRIKR